MAPEGPGSISAERTTERHDPADGRASQSDHRPAEQDQKPDQKPKRRTRWPLIALIIAIIVAAILGVLYWNANKDLVSTDDAYTDGRAVMIAPHVAGYVTILAIDDNQFVHKGDLLVQLDERLFQAAYDQAAGQVAATEAQLADSRVALDKTHKTAPAQLLQARGQLAEAQAQLIQTEAEHKRQHAVDRAATSQQNIDKADAGLQQAQGQIEEAQAKVAQADLVPQETAQAEAQVAQLEGQLLQSKANLAQAQLNLGYTHVIAPQDGWVTKRNVELGDYATTGTPLLAIVSPQLWVTANFKETQLDRMRPGQRVDIAVDAYPQLKLVGHVDSLQLGSGSRFTAFPPENATGNFVKIVQRVPVKILIDQGLDPQLPLPLGVSVEPTVRLK
jgi:membrane fusion protein (multidrug efflux system)